MFCSTTKPTNAPTMSVEEAVRVIQIAERARQGRLRAKLNRESRNMNWMFRTDDPGADVAERAAVCIQKVFKNHPTCSFPCPASLLFSKFGRPVQVWRGFIQRRKTQIAREEEMIFLGMVRELCQCG